MSDTIRRFPIYLLVECSESMVGDPIESVKSAIGAVHDELMNDPWALEIAWLSVITFSDSASQVVPLTELSTFSAPDLIAGGGAALGGGLKLLLECIDNEASLRAAKHYKPDWKPTIILFTCSNPTDEWQEPVDKLKTKRLGSIIAVACGEAVDEEILKSITENVIVMETPIPSYFAVFITGILGKDVDLGDDDFMESYWKV